VLQASERPPEDEPSVLTLGHSTRTIEEFVRLLRASGADHLLDVRRFPGSRRHPQFGKETLSARLREEGIGYSHLPGLGGRRQPLPDSPNGGWRNASFRGYADHMDTPEFQENLEWLVGLCGRERVCLMCSEALWWRCHRRMIADALVVRGFPVEHVLGEGSRQTHELTPWAEVVVKVGGDKRLVYPPGDPARAGNGERA
jgi:uncharacterized protein (DUF488 family)